MSNTDIRHYDLSNGLHLIGEITPSSHSCAVGFFVRTGARDETKKESGVSHFLEHMVFKGTEKRSALDITFQMGNYGAQANAYTSEENTVFYSAVIPEYFDSIQELLSDMMRPAIDNAEYDMEKNVILEEIALYKDRPYFSFVEQALEDYFSGHTAGNSVLGTTDSIKALSRDEMYAYFARRYAPNNMVLVAAGNFNWDNFVNNAEKLCSDWKQFETPRATPDHKTNSRQKIFKRKNLNQAHLLLMTKGCSAQSPERYPLGILSLILGDSSGSKLYWELVDPGLAESASFDFDERDGTGCALAYAAFDEKNLSIVKEKLLTVLSKPLNFTDDDLERAKTKLMSRVVLSGELPMGRLMSIGNSWIYRKKVDTLEDIITQIESVNRDSIEDALNKYPLSNWCEYTLLPE